MSLAAFAAAWLLHLMAAISPGPAVLMSARTGMSEGLRTGAILALGLAAGALVWASAALFGLALLFKVAPSLLWGMKIAGAIYLMRMAFVMWREADRPFDTGQAGRPPRSAASAFRLGLFTQLSNPKPAVFFSAIFIGTVPQDAAPWAVGLPASRGLSQRVPLEHVRRPRFLPLNGRAADISASNPSSTAALAACWRCSA